MTEIRNSILAGLIFGLLFGLFFTFSFDFQHAIIAGPLSGLAFGITIYFFVTSKTVKDQTEIGNVDEIIVIHSGGANHFKNGEAVGGKLYLFADKLQFKSHKLNIQNHELEIDLGQINQIRFYNTLGLVPNGFEILTLDGQIEKFVVSGRKLWRDEIYKIKNRA